MDNQLIQPLAKYIAAEILKQPRREIKPDDQLISSGMIDSLSLVDLALFVEETYGVRIDDTELSADTFDTLEELVELIQQRQV